MADNCFDCIHLQSLINGWYHCRLYDGPVYEPTRGECDNWTEAEQ